MMEIVAKSTFNVNMPYCDHNSGMSPVADDDSLSTCTGIEHLEVWGLIMALVVFQDNTSKAQLQYSQTH